MSKSRNGATATIATVAPTIAHEAPTDDALLLSESLERTAANLDSIADRYTSALARCSGRLHRALLMARAIKSLREAMNENVMAELMPLMNSPNGFKTDRPNKSNPATYSAEQVKEALITGLLAGVFPTGNELNIIAGNCYITQEGYRRKLREVPGLTDLSVAAGIPTQHNGQMVVRVAVSWVKDGRRSRLVGADDKPGRVFAVTGSSPDQLIGKATRKALKAAFEQATNTTQTIDDNDGVVELTEMPTAMSSAQAAIEQLKARLPGAQVAAQVPAQEHLATRQQLETLANLARALEWSHDEFVAEMHHYAKVDTPEELTAAQAKAMILGMEGLLGG